MSVSQQQPSKYPSPSGPLGKKPYIKRLILQHNERKVLVNLPLGQGGLYCHLQEQATKLFSEVGNDSTKIILCSTELSELDGEEIEVSPDAIRGVFDDGIRLLVVKLQSDKVKATLSTSCSHPGETVPAEIVINVVYGSRPGKVKIKCAPNARVQELMDVIRNASGICNDNQRWLWEGQTLMPYDTLSGSGVKEGDTLAMVERQTGGKPVIYLYPPTATRISATLCLVPEWEFSAIYPVVPAKTTEAGQELKWVVDAERSGTLTEVGTGLEVSYLYWEAETTAKGLVSPPLSLVLGATTAEAPFVPNQASLDSKDTVLLEVAKMTQYLDGALKALGLHVEARTSFITYWLPSLLKHDYVALRFLPQSVYERAAPLAIEPTPDVVARIFMLFKGVKANELPVWSEAFGRATEDVGRWADVVGIDLGKVRDAGLFRVIEWGGMEVLN
ncbi:hypothetical protein DFP72DRAFT_1146391 [Ephemerocybe angulata]|uniref:Ubiquitin-like domain-containing protein n=1 Tax=Ephemerocybe angulata TaxID=980116 RepID=A0A8H6HKS0_9AGAR|nr:hypothetical protein DFP72DRAFT_1146391 [Tulosesus angulatus]